MDDSRIFIEQQPADEALYTHLQRKTLAELQRLSGKVWTDFNAHDPGVTTADIADYALTEIDYKLGFPLQDYLTGPKGVFAPERYGLFLPEEVYPTAPVTLDDYRKALVAEFPTLEKIDVACDREGNYTVRFHLSPFDDEAPLFEKRVLEWLHAHRNLCERPVRASIASPARLILHSEFEIAEGEDAAVVLARVYWTIMQYLAGNTRIERPDETLTPEERLDGPVTDVCVVIPRQEDTEQELFGLLCRVEGVAGFKTCYLTETEEGREVIRTDFKKGYSLAVPQYASELAVRIRAGDSVVGVDLDRFMAELRAMYFSAGASRIDAGALKCTASSRRKIPAGTYRDLSAHRPLAAELPRCYDRQGYAQGGFGDYLQLFDLLAMRGLAELKGLRQLFSIAPNTATTHLGLLAEGEQPLKVNDRYRNITQLKCSYLDFLDRLYGVESNPAWLDAGCYGETADETIRRRIEFLRRIPRLQRDRAKGWDMCRLQTADNIPTVKAYLCRLFGMNADEGISAGNVLPGHNLILLGDDPAQREMRERLKSMLVDERILDSSKVEYVASDTPPASRDQVLEQYRELRRELPAFGGNLLDGGLFRRGLNLDNYRLVHVMDDEWLLVFRNDEDGCWMNLGRSDKQTVNRWANILRRYLQELNRQCETVYVVERHLFLPPEPFRATFVFSGWTTRLRSHRFREACTQLIRSLLPAHICFDVRWLEVGPMQHFEENFWLWRKALAEERPSNELEAILRRMQRSLGDD